MRKYSIGTNNPEPNMTSMLDIVFILLIFFIVTATFIQENGVQMASLPKTPPQAAANDDTLSVFVNDKGVYHINTNPVDEPALTAIIKQAITNNPDLSLIINAERGTHMGHVIKVLDAGRIAGLRINQIFSTITEG